MCVECCHQPCAAAKLTQKLKHLGRTNGLKITGSNLGHRALQKCRLGKNLKKLAYWVKRISVNVFVFTEMEKVQKPNCATYFFWAF